ncbi:hypothetical protein [Clostridium saccharobutylicum]|uniref:Uncharacterized protein n=1 Tax=Clostridium saccharobutylicum TaxID=169679 RepID=A0A1S8NH17_CLOSA|nr:hypothetical protein [Clostridium saccharobutylicum]OOM15796.1 hypothetical protein CLOSAC_00670 [Clostridium saccharobutylicum]
MKEKETLATLETKLSDIEIRVNEAITFGLESIKSNPSLEKDIIKMFMNTSAQINTYFFNETEKTSTEHVGKSVMKYAMFKKL